MSRDGSEAVVARVLIAEPVIRVWLDGWDGDASLTWTIAQPSAPDAGLNTSVRLLLRLLARCRLRGSAIAGVRVEAGSSAVAHHKIAMRFERCVGAPTQVGSRQIELAAPHLSAQLGSRANAQLRVGPGEMVLDGLGAHDELDRNLAVGHACRHESGDAALLSGQPVGK